MTAPVPLHEGVSLRVYQPQDFATLQALWEAVFSNDAPRNRAEHSVPAMLAQDPDGLIVAVDAHGTVIGSVMSGYDGHRGWLYAVAVSPEHQGKRLGEALVRAAEARLAALGCVKVNLQIRATNAPVARFYHRLGYQVEERISMGRVIAD